MATPVESPKIQSCSLCNCVGKVVKAVSEFTALLTAKKVHVFFEKEKANSVGIKAGLSMRLWSFGAALGDAARAVYEVIACIATWGINKLIFFVPAKYEPKTRDFLGITKDTPSAHLDSLYNGFRSVRYSLISIGSPAKAAEWYGGKL